MFKQSLLILLILAMLVLACATSPSEQLQANKNLVHQFTASLNEKDWDALNELLTEDFRRHCQATPGVQVNSREEFKQLQESFLVSMPDQHVNLEMLIAEGDMVAVYATYSGTQTGPMGEFPPTGKSAESKFLGIFRIADNRIAELWVEFDNLAMLSQLGLFPPPVAPNE
jgi:steroid delta-isomerase-like uncharacterized protein